MNCKSTSSCFYTNDSTYAITWYVLLYDTKSLRMVCTKKEWIIKKLAYMSDIHLSLRHSGFLPLLIVINNNKNHRFRIDSDRIIFSHDFLKSIYYNPSFISFNVLNVFEFSWICTVHMCTGKTFFILRPSLIFRPSLSRYAPLSICTPLSICAPLSIFAPLSLCTPLSFCASLSICAPLSISPLSLFAPLSQFAPALKSLSLCFSRVSHFCVCVCRCVCVYTCRQFK